MGGRGRCSLRSPRYARERARWNLSPPVQGWGDTPVGADSADAGGASKASIAGLPWGEGGDAHFVRLAALERGLDRISPHRDLQVSSPPAAKLPFRNQN